MSQITKSDAKKYHREIEPVLRNNYYQALAQMKYISDNQTYLVNEFLRSSPPALTEKEISKIHNEMTGFF